MADTSANLFIEKMVAGGYGLARHREQVWLVQGALPGEEVDVVVKKQYKSYCMATLRTILKPSPQRVACPDNAFSRSEICNLQHLNYEGQLYWKRQILIEQFLRIAKLTIDPELVLACAHPYHYRQRITMQLNRQGQLGVTQRGSHQVLPVDTYPIAIPPLEQVVKRWATFPEGLRCRLAAVAHEIELMWDEERQVVLLIPKKSKCTVKQSLKKEWVKWGIVISKSQGFRQVNPFQNQKLKQLVKAHLQVQASDRLLELYCGDMNLTRDWGHSIEAYLGIEQDSNAVRKAIAYLAPNQEILCASVAALPLLEKVETFHCNKILLDPPRQGATEAISLFADMEIERITYVSCDMGTLARDSARLVMQGFQLNRISPLDMFPQTDHLEVVASFTRSQSN